MHGFTAVWKYRLREEKRGENCFYVRNALGKSVAVCACVKDRMQSGYLEECLCIQVFFKS